MRRDFLGLTLSLTDNKFIFLNSLNLRYSYKYILITSPILLFFLQFFRFNSLTYQTTLNEFTANESFLLDIGEAMAFIVSYLFIIPKFNVRLSINA
jgi:hypothetical protein